MQTNVSLEHSRERKFNVRPVSSSLSSQVLKTRSDFQMSPREGVALLRNVLAAWRHWRRFLRDVRAATLSR